MRQVQQDTSSDEQIGSNQMKSKIKELFENIRKIPGAAKLSQSIPNENDNDEAFITVKHLFEYLKDSDVGPGLPDPDEDFLRYTYFLAKLVYGTQAVQGFQASYVNSGHALQWLLV